MILMYILCMYVYLFTFKLSTFYKLYLFVISIPRTFKYSKLKEVSQEPGFLCLELCDYIILLCYHIVTCNSII